jgi:hypothetical protein
MFSQNENRVSFKLEENEIIWQKVIEYENTKDKYIEKLKLKEFFNYLEWDANSIAGKSSKKTLKLKSPNWASFPFDCFIKIEFKENRCRITFSNITFEGPEIQFYGVLRKYDYKLSDQGLKEGELKKYRKIKNVIKELNVFFENITSEKQIEKKSDW